MSCGVGCRRGSDPALLWHRLAAVAPIGPLPWVISYAEDEKHARTHTHTHTHSTPNFDRCNKQPCKTITFIKVYALWIFRVLWNSFSIKRLHLHLRPTLFEPSYEKKWWKNRENKSTNSAAPVFLAVKWSKPYPVGILRKLGEIMWNKGRKQDTTVLVLKP